MVLILVPGTPILIEGEEARGILNRTLLPPGGRKTGKGPTQCLSHKKLVTSPRCPAVCQSFSP